MKFQFYRWSLLRLRSSHQRCSMTKDVLRNFSKFTGKHVCQSLLFNKAATLLKKRLWHRRFPVNFAKFLRAIFLQNTSGWLLLWFSQEFCRILEIFFFLWRAFNTWLNKHFDKILNYRKMSFSNRESDYRQVNKYLTSFYNLNKFHPKKHFREKLFWNTFLVLRASICSTVKLYF